VKCHKITRQVLYKQAQNESRLVFDRGSAPGPAGELAMFQSAGKGFSPWTSSASQGSLIYSIYAVSSLSTK